MHGEAAEVPHYFDVVHIVGATGHHNNAAACQVWANASKAERCRDVHVRREAFAGVAGTTLENDGLCCQSKYIQPLLLHIRRSRQRLGRFARGDRYRLDPPHTGALHTV